MRREVGIDDGRKEFLRDLPHRAIKLESSHSLSSLGLIFDQGPSALDVIAATAPSAPGAPALRSSRQKRGTGRFTPLLLVVRNDDVASICGPAGEVPPAYFGTDIGQVERSCREALDQLDRHAALRALRDTPPLIETELAGVRSAGPSP
jgi:hypothetical protein